VTGPLHGFVNLHLPLGHVGDQKGIQLTLSLSLAERRFHLALLLLRDLVPDLGFLFVKPASDLEIGSFGLASVDDETAGVLRKL